MLTLLLIATSLTGAGSLFAADAEPHSKVKVCGPDEAYCADVKLQDAVKRLQTSAKVTVEEIFGQDPHATSWFYIGTATDADGVGAAGDTVRVQIPAAVSPLDLIYPAVDVTTTVTAGCVSDPNPEICLAEDICDDLNSDSDFQDSEWECIVIKDHSGVFIENKLFNEFGERTTWTVSSTGTTVVNQAFPDFVRRGLPTELQRSPNDPRQGILAISGEIQTNPAGKPIRRFFLRRSNGSRDMSINGGAGVYFTLQNDPDYDPARTLIITEIRLHSTAGSIQLGAEKFIEVSELDNGMLWEIRGNCALTYTENLKLAEDIHHRFAFGESSRFDLILGSGDASLVATLVRPIIIRKTNDCTIHDDVSVLIRDDLSTSSISRIEVMVVGFYEDD